MKPDTYTLDGNGRIPNSDLAMVVYRKVASAGVEKFERDLRVNEWIPEWHSSIGLYPAHHFHSDAHELILVSRGELIGEFGGPGGLRLHLQEGDVVVIPAGVGHFGLEISDDLRLTGAFPVGYSIHDFRLGYPSEYAQVFAASRSVPVPSHDPIFGPTGPLVGIWQNARGAN